MNVPVLPETLVDTLAPAIGPETISRLLISIKDELKYRSGAALVKVPLKATGSLVIANASVSVLR